MRALVLQEPGGKSARKVRMTWQEPTIVTAAIAAFAGLIQTWRVSRKDERTASIAAEQHEEDALRTQELAYLELAGKLREELRGEVSKNRERIGLLEQRVEALYEDLLTERKGRVVAESRVAQMEQEKMLLERANAALVTQRQQLEELLANTQAEKRLMEQRILALEGKITHLENGGNGKEPKQ